MTSVEDQLHRYATAVAGPPAHPEPPADTDAPGHRPPAALVVALAAFVIVGALAVVKAQDPQEKELSPSVTQPAPSSEDLQGATDRLRDALNSGYSPYGFTDPSTGEETVGYLPVAANEASLAPLYDPQQKRIPVLAEPRADAPILGYDFSWIGFVTTAVVESGTFDPTATRIAKYGCDPLASSEAAAQACQQQIEGR